MRFEPATYGFQIRCSNHSATLPPQYNTFLESTENCRCCLFMSHVPESQCLRVPHPQSPSPHVPCPCVPRPGVPVSHVPASPSPTSPSHTSQSPRVLTSQVPSPRPTFSHSRFSKSINNKFLIVSTYIKLI